MSAPRRKRTTQEIVDQQHELAAYFDTDPVIDSWRPGIEWSAPTDVLADQAFNDAHGAVVGGDSYPTDSPGAQGQRDDQRPSGAGAPTLRRTT